jgi:cell migration-inducing and hyaluronan-binding protein
MEHKWSNDDYGNGSYQTAVFHDVDGSVSGVRDSYILINDENDAIAIDQACEIKPTWNAAVCKGDVGRLAVGAPGAATAPTPGAVPSLAALRGGPGGPPQPPVTLSRNGKEFTLTGETNIRAGTEIKVTTKRQSVALRLSELDSGSWVIFELPGFTTAASGTEQSSLDALRKASVTSYYKGNDSLWVKLVSTGDVLGSGPGSGPGAGTSLEVSR